jgi:hypothetical protein
LVLIFPPLFMMLPGIFDWIDAALQPIASVRVAAPIALLNTLIIAFYLFSMRDALHHATLTRRFKKDPGRPVAIWALIFFVIAVFITYFLGFGLANKNSIVGVGDVKGQILRGSTGHLMLKLAMTGLLVFVFVFLSLAAGMMAAYVYGEYVDEQRPDPIYLNEELMLEVVLRFVRQQLGSSTGPVISEMKRTEDGGISLNLYHRGELTTLGDIKVREDKTWHVQADCWGRVKEIDEIDPRLIQVSEET